jgi:ribosomal protein S18 acetylase RimI-like enzyme
MTTTTDRQDFQRALEMERRLLAAAAERAEEHPLGLLLFDAARPRVWVHNQLHVTGPAGDIDDLVRVLDEHYGHLAHRRAVVEDPVEGERLAGGFRDRGWQVETHVFMALREDRDRAPDATSAAQVSADEHQQIERRTLAEEAFAADAGFREQLIDARVARRLACERCHCIAGIADGQRVGTTVVYVAGDLAQVEDVTTLPSFRNRGVARAMVSLACDLAGDCDLVWLAADEDDWPKELYFKLGFRPIGRIFLFTLATQGTDT